MGVGVAKRAGTDEGEELDRVEMLLLARLADNGAWRLGGEPQALDDEGRMAQEMRLADEVGQGLGRFQPLAVGELQRNPVEDSNRRRQGVREQQCGGKRH